MTEHELIDAYFDGGLGDIELDALYHLLSTDREARELFRRLESIREMMIVDRGQIEIPPGTYNRILDSIDSVPSRSAGGFYFRGALAIAILVGLACVIWRLTGALPADGLPTSAHHSRRGDDLTFADLQGNSQSIQPVSVNVSDRSAEVPEPPNRSDAYASEERLPSMSIDPASCLAIQYGSLGDLPQVRYAVHDSSYLLPTNESMWTGSVNFLRSFDLSSFPNQTGSTSELALGVVVSLKRRFSDHVSLGVEIGREYVVQSVTKQIPNTDASNQVFIATPLFWGGVSAEYAVFERSSSEFITPFVNSTIGLAESGPILRAGLGIDMRVSGATLRLGCIASSAFYNDAGTWHVPMNVSVTLGIGLPL